MTWCTAVTALLVAWQPPDAIHNTGGELPNTLIQTWGVGVVLEEVHEDTFFSIVQDGDPPETNKSTQTFIDKQNKLMTFKTN